MDTDQWEKLYGGKTVHLGEDREEEACNARCSSMEQAIQSKSETIVNRELVFPALLAALMLFAALGQWPYGYYKLLRWIVCGAGAYLGLHAYETNRTVFVWAFAAVILLFNPLVPVHLSKATWAPIDIIVGLLFMVSALMPQSSRPNIKA